MILNIWYCTGDNKTGRKHMELTRILFIVTNIFASSDDYLYFNGNFEDWFKYWVRIKTETKLFNIKII